LHSVEATKGIREDWMGCQSTGRGIGWG